MADTDPNLTIDITGTTASIATDYTSSGITNSHVQVVKLAYGGPAVATRVDTATPLPVTLIGQTANVGITGYVGGLGNFKVINGLSGITSVPLNIQGVTGGFAVNITGRVQGITSGTLFGVTGTVNVGNTYFAVVGVSGGREIGITGGRRLNSSTDSVTVSGIVGISGGRQLAAATDSVRVYNWDGATGVDVSLFDGSGNSLSSTSNALNVFLTNAGFTATVSINPIVGVTNSAATALFIQGVTSGIPVTIQGGLTGGAMYVGCPTNNPLPVQVTNALEVDNTTLVDAVSSDSSVLISNVKEISSNTSTISSINTKLSSSATVFNTKINEIQRPINVYTDTVNAGSAKTILGSAALKTGITIKAAQANEIQIEVYGGTSTNPYVLDAGESIFVETSNLGNVSVKKPDGSSAAAVAKLYIIAS